MNSFKKVFLAISLLSMFYLGCQPDDISAPDVVLLGDASLYWPLGVTFVDPGATAIDEQEGDLSTSIQVSSNVNTAQVGEYSVTYECSDSEGNLGRAIRTVKVVPTVDYLLGSYSVSVIPTFSQPTACPANLASTMQLSLSSNEPDLFILSLSPFPTTSGALTIHGFFQSILERFNFYLPAGQSLSTGEEIVGAVFFRDEILPNAYEGRLGLTFRDPNSGEMSACNIELDLL